MRRILPAPLRTLSPALAVLLLTLPLLSGCGLKGDLVLPDDAAPTVPADEESDEDEA